MLKAKQQNQKQNKELLENYKIKFIGEEEERRSRGLNPQPLDKE